MVKHTQTIRDIPDGWLFDTEGKKVTFPCTSTKRDTKMKGIPLIMTYHPLLRNFASVIRKHVYIVYFILMGKKIGKLSFQG